MAIKRERVEKIVLIAVVASMGTVAVWMFYLRQRIKIITGGGKELAALEEQYQEAQNMIKRADRSEKNLGETKRAIGELDREMPPERMDEWILDRVNNICNELNVRYEFWSPQEAGEFKDKTMAQSYRRKKVKLALRCDYHTLGKFLNQIENTSPFISIGDIAMRDSGAPDRQEAQFSINYVARKE